MADPRSCYLRYTPTTTPYTLHVTHCPPHRVPAFTCNPLPRLHTCCPHPTLHPVVATDLHRWHYDSSLLRFPFYCRFPALPPRDATYLSACRFAFCNRRRRSAVRLDTFCAHILHWYLNHARLFAFYARTHHQTLHTPETKGQENKFTTADGSHTPHAPACHHTPHTTCTHTYHMPRAHCTFEE